MTIPNLWNQRLKTKFSVKNKLFGLYVRSGQQKGYFLVKKMGLIVSIKFSGIETNFLSRVLNECGDLDFFGCIIDSKLKVNYK